MKSIFAFNRLITSFLGLNKRSMVPAFERAVTFEDTVTLLTKSYHKGTLVKGCPAACGVGNIIANALGCDMVIHERAGLHNGNVNRYLQWKKDGNDKRVYWHRAFMTVEGVQHHFGHNASAILVKEQIIATGYTIAELARIEFAFESASPNFDDDAEALGLAAVIDVLADIHGIDLTAIPVIAKQSLSSEQRRKSIAEQNEKHQLKPVRVNL